MIGVRIHLALTFDFYNTPAHITKTGTMNTLARLYTATRLLWQVDRDLHMGGFAKAGCGDWPSYAVVSR